MDTQWALAFAVAYGLAWTLSAALRKASELVSGGEIVFFHCEKKVVNVPIAAASAFIRDVGNLPSYEQKVHSSRVISRPDAVAGSDGCAAGLTATGKRLAYQLAGGWCLYPWTASFLLTPTRNGGFHSRIIPLRPGYAGVTMTAMAIHGGFALRSLADGTTLVTHYESYRWHPCFALLRFQPLYRAMARWHASGMRVEMAAVKIAMQAAAARGTSRPPAPLEHFLRRSHLTLGRFIVQELTGMHYDLPELPPALQTPKPAS